MRAFGGISVAHCVAANLCSMAFTIGNRQLCNVAAPLPTKILRLFSGALWKCTSLHIMTPMAHKCSSLHLFHKLRSPLRGALLFACKFACARNWVPYMP